MTQPSNREKLLELAKRVEGLSGQDGETDALIHIAIGLGEGNTHATPLGWCVGSKTNPNPVRSPSYTFSLDAAMTLVPSGWAISTGHACDGDEADFTTLLTRSEWDDVTDETIESSSDNWAASICAAALRASSTLSTGDEK